MLDISEGFYLAFTLATTLTITRVWPHFSGAPACWTSLYVHKSIIFGKTKECSQIRMSHKKSIHCPKKLKNNTHLQYHPLFYYKRMMKENSRGTQFSGLRNSHFQIFLLIIPHLFLSCKLLQHCNYFSEHWINRLTWVCGFLCLQTQTISI